MANITTILGTDSISSSRIVLNDNFTAVNSELTTISGLFNSTYTNLTLTDTVTAAKFYIASGLSINSTSCTITPATTIDGELKLNNGFKHSWSTAISVAPTSGNYTLSTYQWDAATQGSWTLAAGDSGQEITIIAKNGALTIPLAGSNIANIGANTNMTVAQDANVTLRYVGSSWYVIGRSITGVSMA
jgi:hypothetical protein